MDFNPLDLLASAAELQQKSDDGPDGIIVTRQRRNNLNLAKHVPNNGHKENRDHPNNNNGKNKQKPSVVIVKKLKVDNLNPELEKMFDEHNYGNAKKTNNNKYDQEEEGSHDLNRSTKKIMTVGVDTPLSTTSGSEYETVPTGLLQGDKIAVVAVASQSTNSGCNTPCVAKCSLECSKGTCPPVGCSEQCTCENETREVNGRNCKPLFECRTQSVHTHHKGQNNVNTTPLGDKHEGLITSHRSQQCAYSEENTELGRTDVTSFKLDDKTGEFITESGAKVIIKSLAKVKAVNTDINGESPQRLVHDKPKCTESEKVIHKMVAVKNAKNLKLDSTSVKSTSIITSAKMPYVKVIPSKEIMSDNTSLNKQPETLVINISRGQNSSSQLTKSAALNDKSLQATTVNGCDTASVGGNSSNNVGVIKSIVLNDNSVESKKNEEVAIKPKPLVFTMLSPKSKIEIPSCDTSKFHSSESLKTLDLRDSVCTGESTSSVHLLSPDRRNPDSMGIVESPVTQNETDCVDHESSQVTFPFTCDKSEVNLLNDQCFEHDADSSGITKNFENPSKDSAVETSVCEDKETLVASATDMISDSCELMKESSFDSTDKSVSCDYSANSDVPVFRFDSDHCYAGVPGTSGKPENDSSLSLADTNEASVPSESEEAQTPQGSTSELSQDSGYEDVSHSPETETPTITLHQTTDKSVVKNLVPVLVSVNSNGSLTLHDTNLAKSLPRPVLALPETLSSLASGIKVLPGTGLTSISQPLILSPVGKSTSPILADGSRPVQAKQTAQESIIGLLCPKVTEQANSVKIVQSTQQISPPKFGTFKIGTFASFSNTGMGLENNVNAVHNPSSSVKYQVEDKTKKAATRSRSNSGKSSPGVVDTLGSLVQKVKGNLSQTSPAQSSDGQPVDHIQHDHDYCTKNLMPSVVSSLFEARLLNKDNLKGKLQPGKVKKSETDVLRDIHRAESKLNKRKRSSSCMSKVDSQDEFDIDSESDTQSVCEPLKAKARFDKLLEKTGRTTDPKVKITGSSNFQDQFVYFMNTKKRSRRRESKDVPLPFGDRVFIPPKPGDIIVPHLTDQDIENLKQRSKQCKQSGNMLGYNSLRNEFMAAKFANTPYSGLFSSTDVPLTTADDEKSIINTILSLENETLTSPVHSEPPSYNESMEMYGQGIGNDIMNLFSEQLNLTPEQMDLLYSAVDEVQNSSPGLVGSEKLVSTETGDPTFGQFPEFERSTENEGSNPVTSGESRQSDKTESKALVTSDKPCEGDEDAVTSAEDMATTTTPAVAATETAVVTDLPADHTLPTDQDSTSRPETPASKAADDDSVSEKQKATPADTDVTVLPEKVTTHVTDTEKEQAEEEMASTEQAVTVSKLPQPVANDDQTKSTDSSPTDLPTSVASTSSIESTNISEPVTTAAALASTVTETGLFSTTSTPSPSLSNDIAQANPTTLSSDMALSQLDILGLDNNMENIKNELFTDTGVTVPAQAALPTNTNSLRQTTTPAVEYNAPWIVTVSMFWNDLPATMNNNQPYVRLVDIHKQILPAKDTGILKKRCQLMGIKVENCSEMQRYFLVQYGKAFNSKSTLIISQDNAKVLIGYYVNPQPKTARGDDHKSIIDHRREQLRRIALARRAAMKAQRSSEKKDDPREIKDTDKPAADSQLTRINGVSDGPKPAQVAKASADVANSQGNRSQRATRHKKINFLEMLRGDSASAGVDDDASEVSEKKHKRVTDTETRKRKKPEERKVKIVQYTIETDSSEETDTVSEYTSSSDTETETDSETELLVLKKQPTKRKIVAPITLHKPNARAKDKSTPPNKSFTKDSLKVKIGTNRSRSTTTSTPISVQVIGKSKSTGMLSPTASPVYGQKTLKFRAPNSAGVKRNSSPFVYGKKNSTKSIEGQINHSHEEVEHTKSDQYSHAATQIASTNITIDHSSILSSTSVSIGEKDLKVSATLPDEILDVSEPSECSEDLSAHETTASDNADENHCNVTQNNNSVTSHTDVQIQSFETPKHGDSNPPRVLPLSDDAVLFMKRKESVQVGANEVPLRILHRDASPLAEPRSRSQLGEVFVERYHNKKSVCVRCYTCRKMMTVDNFMRHLHDVISGGLMTVTSTRTVDSEDCELTDGERKSWETFQRKKELFDNNQIPSPDIVSNNLMYNLDSEHDNLPTPDGKPVGPRIINTPVSPLKKQKIIRNSKAKQSVAKPKLQSSGSKQTAKQVMALPVDSGEGVRSSSRKRKVKQLYPFEEYSFSKFPRMMKNAEDNTSC